jgi:predicted RNase H-like HicB family nuclease
MEQCPHKRKPSTVPPSDKAQYGDHCGRNEQGPTIGYAEADLSTSRLAEETEVNEYAIVIEDAGANLAAYVPDLPGCIGAADTIEEIEVLMRDAIEFHIEGMLLHGEEVPPPTTRVSTVRVAP